MPLSMVFRVMLPDDAPAVALLCGQLGYPATATDVAARFARLELNDAHAFWVAEKAGVVVGWIHVAERVSLETEGFGEIAALVVDAGHRGQRVGEQLMAAAERWIAGRGFRKARVRSNVVRVDAHRFYQRLGYQILKTQHAFAKSL